MATFRSNGGDEAQQGTSSDAEDPWVEVDPEPTREEAAAIAAAIRCYVDAEHATTEGASSAEWWRTRAWRFHSRFQRLRGSGGRPREDLPRAPWRAADRLRRS